MSRTTRSVSRLACLALIGALALATAANAGDPSEISRSDALAMQKAGDDVLFIDVRTPTEYAAGYVPGAVNISRNQLPQHFAELKAKYETIVVYCERGPRALAAAATLMSAGFEDVRHLSGDMSGWRAAGLPVAK
jgi:phage shock protein E